MEFGNKCKYCKKGIVRPIQFNLKQAFINCDNSSCSSILNTYPWECVITRNINSKSYSLDKFSYGSESIGIESDICHSTEVSSTDKEVESILKNCDLLSDDVFNQEHRSLSKWRSCQKNSLTTFSVPESVNCEEELGNACNMADEKSQKVPKNGFKHNNSAKLLQINSATLGPYCYKNLEYIYSWVESTKENSISNVETKSPLNSNFKPIIPKSDLDVQSELAKPAASYNAFSDTNSPNCQPIERFSHHESSKYEKQNSKNLRQSKNNLKLDTFSPSYMDLIEDLLEHNKDSKNNINLDTHSSQFNEFFNEIRTPLNSPVSNFSVKSNYSENTMEFVLSDLNSQLQSPALESASPIPVFPGDISKNSKSEVNLDENNQTPALLESILTPSLEVFQPPTLITEKKQNLPMIHDVPCTESTLKTPKVKRKISPAKSLADKRPKNEDSLQTPVSIFKSRELLKKLKSVSLSPSLSNSPIKTKKCQGSTNENVDRWSVPELQLDEVVIEVRLQNKIQPNHNVVQQELSSTDGFITPTIHSELKCNIVELDLSSKDGFKTPTEHFEQSVHKRENENSLIGSYESEDQFVHLSGENNKIIDSAVNFETNERFELPESISQNAESEKENKTENLLCRYDNSDVDYLELPTSFGAQNFFFNNPQSSLPTSFGAQNFNDLQSSPLDLSIKNAKNILEKPKNNNVELYPLDLSVNSTIFKNDFDTVKSTNGDNRISCPIDRDSVQRKDPNKYLTNISTFDSDNFLLVGSLNVYNKSDDEISSKIHHNSSSKMHYNSSLKTRHNSPSKVFNPIYVTSKNRLNSSFIDYSPVGKRSSNISELPTSSRNLKSPIQATLERNLNDTQPIYDYYCSTPKPKSQSILSSIGSPEVRSVSVHPRPLPSPSPSPSIIETNSNSPELVDIYIPIKLHPEILDPDPTFGPEFFPYFSSESIRKSVGFMSPGKKAKEIKRKFDHWRSNLNSKYYDYLLSTFQFDENFCEDKNFRKISDLDLFHEENSELFETENEFSIFPSVEDKFSFSNSKRSTSQSSDFCDLDIPLESNILDVAMSPSDLSFNEPLHFLPDLKVCDSKGNSRNKAKFFENKKRSKLKSNNEADLNISPLNSKFLKTSYNYLSKAEVSKHNSNKRKGSVNSSTRKSPFVLLRDIKKTKTIDGPALLKNSGWSVTSCDSKINYYHTLNEKPTTIVPFCLKDDSGSIGSDMTVWAISNKNVRIPKILQKPEIKTSSVNSSKSRLEASECKKCEFKKEKVLSKTCFKKPKAVCRKKELPSVRNTLNSIRTGSVRHHFGFILDNQKFNKSVVRKVFRKNSLDESYDCLELPNDELAEQLVSKSDALDVDSGVFNRHTFIPVGQCKKSVTVRKNDKFFTPRQNLLRQRAVTKSHLNSNSSYCSEISSEHSTFNEENSDISDSLSENSTFDFSPPKIISSKSGKNMQRTTRNSNNIFEKHDSSDLVSKTNLGKAKPEVKTKNSKSKEISSKKNKDSAKTKQASLKKNLDSSKTKQTSLKKNLDSSKTKQTSSKKNLGSSKNVEIEKESQKELISIVNEREEADIPDVVCMLVGGKLVTYSRKE